MVAKALRASTQFVTAYGNESVASPQKSRKDYNHGNNSYIMGIALMAFSVGLLCGGTVGIVITWIMLK